MNRQEQFQKHKEYVKFNELDKLINFQENIEYKKGVFDSTSGKLDIPIPPETNDLIRLHKLIDKSNWEWNETNKWVETES